MRLAIPHWQCRISPVLDVAGCLLLIDVDDGTEINRVSVFLEDDTAQGRAKRIARLGVNVLICGAISKPLEFALVAEGVEVIPRTCGEVEQIVRAYLTDRLRQDCFLMPGCHRRRNRFRGGGRGGGYRQ